MLMYFDYIIYLIIKDEGIVVSGQNYLFIIFDWPKKSYIAHYLVENSSASISSLLILILLFFKLDFVFV